MIDLDEIAIPTLENGRNGKWAMNPEIGENGAIFRLDYGSDTVIYYSVIAYTVSTDEGTASYQANERVETSFSVLNYTLVTPTAVTAEDGTTYTFIGWYQKTTGGIWEKVETLSLAAVQTEITVEALWMSDLKVTITAQRNRSGLNYLYTITGEISGGVLVGAFSEEAFVKSTQYKFFVNNSEEGDVSANAQTTTFDYSYVATCTNNEIKNSIFTTAPYAHVVASVTYAYGDITITTANAHAVKNCR